MRTAIIIDSTSGVSDEFRNREDVYVAELTVEFPDGTLVRDKTDDETQQMFYTKLSASEKLPTTSQPSPQQFYDIFDAIIEDGYDSVFMVLISSGLSGTYQTAYTIAEEYRDRLNIHVLDSKLSTIIEEFYAKQIFALVDQGKSFDEVVEIMEGIADQGGVYFVVDDINNLVKGGRLSPTVGKIGTALKIKPIVTLNEDDGKVVVHSLSRSRKKAIKSLRNALIGYMDQVGTDIGIAILNANVPETGPIIYEAIEDIIEEHDLMYVFEGITPVVGTHVGQGCMGFLLFNKASLIR